MPLALGQSKLAQDGWLRCIDATALVGPGEPGGPVDSESWMSSLSVPLRISVIPR
jgi:hypothetical protein